MKITRLLQITLLAALTLVTAGCGRSYHITGRVVVLAELGSAGGAIIEFTGMSLPQGGSPIAGAKVKMFHSLDKNDQPESGSIWVHETETDENGFFDTSDYATPSKRAKVGLEISKEGYKTVYRTYMDDSEVEPQTFFVVLIPVAKSSSSHVKRTVVSESYVRVFSVALWSALIFPGSFTTEPQRAPRIAEHT